MAHPPEKYLEAAIRLKGNRGEIAKELGVSVRSVVKWLGRLKEEGHEIPDSEYVTDRRAYLIKQVTASHEAAPDGFRVKGVSTLYDSQGEITAQWVKTTADEERRQEALKAAYKAMAEEVWRAPPTEAPGHVIERLANLYTLTDCHIGMHSWGFETGQDWDLKRAEEVITGVFLQMIASSPPARLGIVNQLGDFLHFDSLKAVTPASGHILDADSRYQKMVQVAVKVLRRIVLAAVAKHQEVIVQIADDNHGPVGQTWLRVMFQAIFENEPRVRVEMSPGPFTVVQHGKTMLGFHHGHTVKNANLPLLFAALYREIWGATEHCYIHTGHLHHVEEKEHPGVIVIRHPTLAAPDSYSHRNGFKSKQSASSITYHSEHGQVGRQTFVPEMLAA